ncbi:cytochrome c biogenesis CcdA family protein [Nocardioides sp. CPCC 205120]|uniref:cytochrome c biogenesis CcdA family protein n=1 Tax=Nocardioides sp. CPCC 205120 TaxID=3406462 RepID=UPI003B501492
MGDAFAEAAGSGSLLLAVPVALLAGLVSFFSPCVLPLVPGYLSYATGMSAAEVATATGAPGAPAAGTGGSDGAGGVGTANRVRRGRLLAGALLFVAGFAVVFVLLGVASASIATWFFEWQRTLTIVLGALTIVLGLAFAGWLRLPWLQRDYRVHAVPSVGLAAAPLLGFLFGLGWTPCVGPTLAAITALAANEGTAGRGALLSGVYALGLGIPFVLLALGFGWSMRAVGWLRRRQELVMRIGGLLLVVVGVLLVTGWWDVIVQDLQRSLISGYEVSV